MSARSVEMLHKTVKAAYQLAIDRRWHILGDVFHPDFLHPARTALILIEDTACNDPQTLAAAVLCETEFSAMRIDAEQVLIIR